MKKLLIIAALAAAMVGCDVDGSHYNRDATREQLKAECKRFGGELNTFRYGSVVRDNPWEGNCINVTTGNKYDVYVPGVPK